MLIYCSVMLTLIFLILLYILRVLNNGFSIINKSVIFLTSQCKVLIGVADKVIGKYKNMTSSIEEMKG